MRMSNAEYLAYEANQEAKRVQRLRKRGVLPPEPPPAPSKADVKAEVELHMQFIGWCRINGIEFVHSRMDRRSTIEEGWPDFTCIKGGCVCCVEFKLSGKMLTGEQAEVMLRLVDNGIPYRTCYILSEAIEFTRKELLE